jgi:hypothetical protein
MKINKYNTTHKQNQGQNHIISLDVEKAFFKVQNPFIITTLKKLEIEGTFPKVIKNIHDKPIANTILNWENLKPFL